MNSHDAAVAATVLTESRGNARIVTLNRPEASDAMTPDMVGSSITRSRSRGRLPKSAALFPTAHVAVMGPRAAVNSVYANKIDSIPDPTEREAFIAENRAEHEKRRRDVATAVDSVIDAIIEPSEPRNELIQRYRPLIGKKRETVAKRHAVANVSEHMTDGLRIHGFATAEEVVVVLALLARHQTAAAPKTATASGASLACDHSGRRRDLFVVGRATMKGSCGA